jgi:hypothetical protein
VPRIHVHEAHEQVQTDSRADRNDEVGEKVIANDLWCLGIPELNDNNVDRCEGGVGHDDTVPNHTPQKHLLGSLWPIAHTQDKLHAYQEYARIPQNIEDILPYVVAERIKFGVRERSGDKEKGQVEIGEGEKGEHERDKLVDKFDVEENFAPKAVISGPNLFEVQE